MLLPRCSPSLRFRYAVFPLFPSLHVCVGSISARGFLRVLPLSIVPSPRRLQLLSFSSLRRSMSFLLMEGPTLTTYVQGAEQPFSLLLSSPRPRHHDPPLTDPFNTSPEKPPTFLFLTLNLFSPFFRKALKGPFFLFFFCFGSFFFFFGASFLFLRCGAGRPFFSSHEPLTIFFF